MTTIEDRAGSESEAWGRAARWEPRWPARVAILCAAALNFILPGKFTLGPPWLVPILEIAILAPLAMSGRRSSVRARRIGTVTILGIASAANVTSLVLLIRHLLLDPKNVTGNELFYSSLAIWATNVIVFAVWFWEIDRGGPDERVDAEHEEPDFLFPQMTTPGCTKDGWSPSFLDYFYVSFTNATAFSPTDTMPLTPWAKTLMMLESGASLATVAIVASRAINILS